MANLTFATIKIATKEDINNVFVFSLLKKFAAEKPSRFESIVLSKNREYVIVNYIPSLDFDIYDLIEEISKKYSCTFSTIGHSYGNMQQTTVEYIVAYKNGEVVFEGDYPLVVFDDDGEMDDDGGYPIDEEATKAIRNKLEADKKEWFPTFYQELEKLNSDEEDVVWQPSSEKVIKEPFEKFATIDRCEFFDTAFLMPAGRVNPCLPYELFMSKLKYVVNEAKTRVIERNTTYIK